jgi:HNH endonuclease/AP2 domain
MTQEQLMADKLRALVAYDPATGVFTWRQTNERPPNWNALYAGERAGYVNKTLGRRMIAILVGGKKRRFYASRLAWLYMMGEWPPCEVDHESLDKTDDSWGNLRLATSAQNKCNKGHQSNNVLRQKGVSFDKSRGKFCAFICVAGKNRALGRYQTIDEAAAAYAAAAIEFHGEFWRTE